ncbi:hypothetical protein IEQ34_007027 [Dendrobium chrysotoxum]|uniref:FANCL UBC-like domain-containing protein n=1 Tax=Dendrobium chrysotoxum TaxID=161865 RepID=A0AAV7H6P8_DENCH|nr:hypothetical protein IEQ34_007027 [Dendrobium chrysotoxum]
MSNSRLGPPPSLYHTVYAEIEEVGWEHLVHLEKDLSSLSFCILDENERKHTLFIRLSQDYPKGLPSIAAKSIEKTCSNNLQLNFFILFYNMHGFAIIIRHDTLLFDH